MKVSDFDFLLPEGLIAQSPIVKRDQSRLMVLNRQQKTIEHQYFYNIVNYFKPGDILVINNSKVIPARLYGIKDETNAKVEILLLKEITFDLWEILVKPYRRIKEGSIISFGDELKVEIMAIKSDGIAHGRLIYSGLLIEILDRIGEMPLPPYIKEKLQENERYQTIYAKKDGSAAAPTAGFHFTKEVFQKLKDLKVEIIEITLHVGLATFRPVNVENVNEHIMHEESYYISQTTAKKLNDAILANKKIFAVGTTTVRALESNYNNKFKAGYFTTNIFIYPGYQFRVVDHLITNFHLPKSTLLMLVSAFYNQKEIKKAYEVAIEQKYQFFSFGDAMLIY